MVPPGISFVLEQDGERRSFCCAGCRAVAQLITDQGLGQFYDYRSAPAIRPPDREPNDHPWAVCDRPEVQRRLLRDSSHGRVELNLRVDGLNCAACSWLLDRGLRSHEGVDDVSINPLTHEARVVFDLDRLAVSRLIESVERYGFVPRLGMGTASPAAASSGRQELKRLAVAGLGFAQVMSLSAALYLGAFKNMSAGFSSYFVLASMLVATPVVLYAGAPIFRAAIRAISQGRPGMDVPVSLAIVVALAASLVNAFRGEGHVYFDSATMFVFFLTLGRFLEARARRRAGGVVSALAELRPVSAIRRREGRDERVGSIELVPGDVVIVPPGENLPADGSLLSESALLDESLLSGESKARKRSCGDSVLGGSLNLGNSPLEIEVTQHEGGGYVDRVGDLLHRAMSERPGFLQLADRWAGYFVVIVLVLTMATVAVWLAIDASRALEVALAMLVVTCPCALSLASPTAFAVALGRFARLGLLCASTRSIERLQQVRLWLFDKTGTLTEGRIGIAGVDTFADVPKERCLAIAGALEAGIEHPIAQSLQDFDSSLLAQSVELIPGRGVTGTVDGERYRLGSAVHVAYAGAAEDAAGVYLATADQVLARIRLEDRLRPHAQEAIASLAATADIALISGDSDAAVAVAAGKLGINDYRANMLPEDKLALMQARQTEGQVIAAVGDGINDAPFLAQADVSVAMVSGSQLAKASADIIFTGDDLRVLARLPQLATTTLRVVRQNLAWAAAYNLTALPLAAAGVLAPWMAALGMSLSSLLVVGNALRLSGLLAVPEHKAAELPLEMLSEVQ